MIASGEAIEDTTDPLDFIPSLRNADVLLAVRHSVTSRLRSGRDLLLYTATSRKNIGPRRQRDPDTALGVPYS